MYNSDHDKSDDPDNCKDHDRLVIGPNRAQFNLLINLVGQKVKTVYQGRIQPGANMFQANLPSMKAAHLIYILRMGDKKVTGKLLQLKQ